MCFCLMRKSRYLNLTSQQLSKFISVLLMQAFILKLIIIGLFFCLSVKILPGQNLQPSNNFIEITTENDFYYLRLPSDRYYSSGKQLKIQSEIFETGVLAFGKFFPLRLKQTKC